MSLCDRILASDVCLCSPSESECPSKEDMPTVVFQIIGCIVRMAEVPTHLCCRDERVLVFEIEPFWNMRQDVLQLCRRSAIATITDFVLQFADPTAPSRREQEFPLPSFCTISYENSFAFLMSDEVMGSSNYAEPVDVEERSKELAEHDYARAYVVFADNFFFLVLTRMEMRVGPSGMKACKEGGQTAQWHTVASVTHMTYTLVNEMYAAREVTRLVRRYCGCWGRNLGPVGGGNVKESWEDVSLQVVVDAIKERCRAGQTPFSEVD